MNTIAATNLGKKTRQSSMDVGKILRMLAMVLGRIVLLLVALILCLPIILLPITTSVPGWVSILLATAAVTLLILQFRFSLASLGTVRVVSGIVLISLVAVAASQFFAATPPIKDANGQ